MDLSDLGRVFEEETVFEIQCFDFFMEFIFLFGRKTDYPVNEFPIKLGCVLLGFKWKELPPWFQLNRLYFFCWKYIKLMNIGKFHVFKTESYAIFRRRENIPIYFAGGLGWHQFWGNFIMFLITLLTLMINVLMIIFNSRILGWFGTHFFFYFFLIFDFIFCLNQN